MALEVRAFLLIAGTLSSMAGPLKKDLYKPDLEISRRRHIQKPWGALGLTNKMPDTTNQGLNKVVSLCKEEDLTQIFIKSIGGRHYCMKLNKGMVIQDLKKEIQKQLGTPTEYQNLIYTKHSLQHNHTLQDYGIIKDSTIILNLRL